MTQLLVVLDIHQTIATKAWNEDFSHCIWTLQTDMNQLWDWVRARRVSLLLWSGALRNTVAMFVEQCVPKDIRPLLLGAWGYEDALVDTEHPNEHRGKNWAVIKDLALVWNAFPGFGVGNTLIIDDTPNKVRRNPECAYIVSPGDDITKVIEARLQQSVIAPHAANTCATPMMSAEWYALCEKIALGHVHEEHQYLHLIREIIDTGLERGDRTGVGTLSKFGVQMRWSLRGSTLPVFTTKRVFLRGAVEELLWFMSGCTDAKVLQQKNIRIWDANASREFLDARGLQYYDEGDLGPVYGFQWRHSGASYESAKTSYSGKGIDQLQNIIDAIRQDPWSRRILLCSWNPSDIPKMALPPCHILAQFYVHDGKLSCQMYQRSADVGLGLPFNVVSYSLLTHILAQLTGLEAYEFIHTIGDAHVYKSHVEPLTTQLNQTPKPFPTVHFQDGMVSLDDVTKENISVQGYTPGKAISMAMAV